MPLTVDVPQELSNLAPNMRPQGRSGLEQYGGQIYDEWLLDLRGTRAAKVYQEMRDNDATVGALLYAIESLVLQAPRSFEPADDSDEAHGWADLLDNCSMDMTHTFDEFIVEVLSMLPFGYAPFEPVYKVRDDGRWGWREIPIRSQLSTIGWTFDDDEERLTGYVQQPAPSFKQITIPINRLLLFRHRAHKDNPEGRSLLRNAYRSWKFLKLIQEYEGIGVERDATGIPVQEMPIEYIDAMNNAAAPGNLRSAAIAMRDNTTAIRRGAREGLVTVSEIDRDGKPTGFKLRPFMSGGSRQYNTGAIIERYEKRIAMSVMAEFLFVGMGQAGSFALASEKTAMFSMAVGATLRNIEATFNRVAVARLCDLNQCPKDLRPSFRFGDVEQRGLAEVASALAPLIQSGAITPDQDLESELRTLGGLPQKPTEAAPVVQEATTTTTEPPLV